MEGAIVLLKSEIDRTGLRLNTLRSEYDGIREQQQQLQNQIDALRKKKAATALQHARGGIVGFFAGGVTDSGRVLIAQLNEEIDGLLPHLLPFAQMSKECLPKIWEAEKALKAKTELLSRCHERLRKQRVKEALAAQARRDKQQKTAKTRERLDRLRATAASASGKVRQRADRIKKQLTRQNDCPYCGCLLGEDAHADHIYPVCKGGQSVPANMVWACAECNVKKGELTLTAFIIAHSLDRNAIEARLAQLRKDF
jgi:5-methylcytosine-specific restriction endonuclease McrA